MEQRKEIFLSKWRCDFLRFCENTHIRIFTNPICFPATQWPQGLGGQLEYLGVTEGCLVKSLEASSIPERTGGWTSTDEASWPTTRAPGGKVGAARRTGLEAGLPRARCPPADSPLPTCPGSHL